MKPSRPSDEKIVFTRKTTRHSQCVRVDWPENDSSVVWSSIFYWLGSHEIWDSIISGISTKCIPEGSVIYAKLKPSRQLLRDQIGDLYQEWDSTLGRTVFIVSRNQLPNWKRELRGGWFLGWKIRRELLDRIHLVLFNHYDHGFEIVGKSIDPDSLLEVARHVSNQYDLQLQVQESGNPFG